MSDVTAVCIGNGSFFLRVCKISGTGKLWAKYYTGMTNPVPSLPPNPFQYDGSSIWTQFPYSYATDLSLTIWPPSGYGVILVVWAIPDTSSTFNIYNSGFTPAGSSSSSSSSSSASSLQSSSSMSSGSSSYLSSSSSNSMSSVSSISSMSSNSSIMSGSSRSSFGSI